jgi:hypothetical protein
MVWNNNDKNGNGTHALGTTTTPAPPPVAVDGELMKPPPWLAALREAMAGAIKADDLTAVMSKQVEKAKGGDTRAAAFVMDQAHKLMNAAAKQVPSTIVQNNYYDSPRPDAPIDPDDAKSGTLERKLRARARAGAPITGRPDDHRVRPVSDEEEKALRRRQQAAEDEEAGDPLRD